MQAGFWKGQRVLVTGVTGLVGGWLVKELLSLGAYVTGFVCDFNPQSEFIGSGDYTFCSIVNGKLECFADIERAILTHDTSIVIHLGAQAIVSVAQQAPLQTFESNIRGTYNLLEACRLHQQQIKAVVVASSDKAYGQSPTLPYVETMALRGQSPYEVSKTCTDLLAQSYFTSYGLPVAIGRCGNIYGGGDLNWSRIIPGTIKSCLAGEPPIIRSDGSFLRDYIYVKDVTNAYLQMAEAGVLKEAVGEAFNFSPEKAMSVLDVVAAVQKAMGCEHLKPVILNKADGEIRSQFLDSSKAKQILGWSPRYSLETGLVEAVSWYRHFLGRLPEAVQGPSPALASRVNQG